MIVAAGRGTRLRPLTELLPKPALPVRGLPLIAYQLALLAHHGVREVVVNTHHLAERLEDAARRHCPPGVSLTFSRERELLDTGGGIRRVAAFLRESDPCLLVGGDMPDIKPALLRAMSERARASTADVVLDPANPLRQGIDFVGSPIVSLLVALLFSFWSLGYKQHFTRDQIGRASCRERVFRTV